MLASIEDGSVWAVVLDVGQVLGAAGVIVAALIGVSRLRPVKWVWRTLVTDPTAERHRQNVTDVVVPLLIEQTTAVTAQITAVRSDVAAEIKAHTREEMLHIGNPLRRIESRQKHMEWGLSNVAARVGVEWHPIPSDNLTDAAYDSRADNEGEA